MHNLLVEHQKTYYHAAVSQEMRMVWMRTVWTSNPRRHQSRRRRKAAKFQTVPSALLKLVGSVDHASGPLSNLDAREGNFRVRLNNCILKIKKMVSATLILPTLKAV